MESSAAASTETECAICKGPMEDPCSLSVCKHEFCHGCLIRALEVNPHCPLCRKRVQTDDIRLINNTSATGNDQMRTSTRIGFLPFGLAGQVARAPALQLARDFRSSIRLPRLRMPNRISAFERVRSTPARRLLNTHSAVHYPPSASAPGTPAPAPTVQAARPIPAGASLTRLLPHAFSLLSVSSSSSFPFDSEDDDLEDMVEELQWSQLPPRCHSQSPTLRTFACPYCQEDGLDEFDLRDHCNENHEQDRRSVVCPICVSLPHGDPTQVSRNFIGHLNLRHSYYTEDYMNPNQSDMMNEQAAIFESFKGNMQRPA